jgi:hypothetical protein
MILADGQEAAPDAYAWETLNRLPLADAALSLWSFVLQPSFLDGVFQRHRGRSFQEVLTFPTFVDLIGDALLHHGGSGRQSFQRAQEQGRLPTTAEAVYSKLRHVPLPLSLGFFEETTQRLGQVLPTTPPAVALPPSLDGFTIVVGDGKTLKRVAKRLLPARGVAGKVFGGKLLVAFLPARGLAVAMAADPDGEANDCRLVPQLLRRARPLIAGPRLWVFDRQFCDLIQTERLAQQGDHFLIRYHPKVHFHPDATRPARTTADAEGRTVVEQWGWLGGERNPRRRYVRQIALQRPGEEAVILVTDLLDADAVPAADLLAVYLARWGIERVFQQITEVFSLRRLIGSTPQATVFQAAFCLLLYNLVQVVRNFIAAAQPAPCPVESLSAEQIFVDVERELISVSTLLPASMVAAVYAEELTVEKLRGRLQERLGVAWSERWRKAPAKRKGVRTKKAKQSGAHTSVHRLLETYRLQQRANKGQS